MPASQSPELPARARRVLRPWRICFLIYASALTVGTHWPNLEIGPEVPASDKAIHLIAFGGLTILLWSTRWLPRFWMLWPLAMAWAGVDELSQGLPGLNRTVSAFDYLADSLGITSAAVLLWSIRPVGGAANRARIRLLAFVFEEMFSRRGPWLAAIGVALACGLPLAAMLPRVEASIARTAIVIAMTIAIAATLMLWWVQWQAAFRLAIGRKPCLNCGGPTQISDRDPSAATCATCGHALEPWVWSAAKAPSLRRMLASGKRPAFIGIAVVIAGFGIIFLTPVAYQWVITHRTGGWIAPRLVRWIGSIPPETNNAIDLAALLILTAIVIRLYRAGLARHYDRHLRCQACGHDLRGTPADAMGAGRCGECGAAFTGP